MRYCAREVLLGKADSSDDPRARRPACSGHPSVARGVRRSGFRSDDVNGYRCGECRRAFSGRDAKRQAASIMRLEGSSVSASTLWAGTGRDIASILCARSIIHTQAHIACSARGARECSLHAICAGAAGRPIASGDSGESCREEAESSPAKAQQARRRKTTRSAGSSANRMVSRRHERGLSKSRSQPYR